MKALREDNTIVLNLIHFPPTRVKTCWQKPWPAGQGGGKPRACGAQGHLKGLVQESALQKAANAATNLYELHPKNAAASFSDRKLDKDYF